MQEHEPSTSEGLAKDPEAFEALVRRLHGRLAMWIGVRMGPLLRARLTADDVMQETLLEAHRSLGDFKDYGPGSFRRWIFGVAENRLRDLHKYHAAQKRHPARETLLESASPQETALLARLSASGSTPSSLAHRRETVEHLARAIAKLPDDLREVLLLRAIEERTFDEVAQTIGRPASTAKGLFARALRRLKDELGG